MKFEVTLTMDVDLEMWKERHGLDSVGDAAVHAVRQMKSPGWPDFSRLRDVSVRSNEAACFGGRGKCSDGFEVVDTGAMNYGVQLYCSHHAYEVRRMISEGEI